MNKDVMLWAGAGQIGLAIARRVGAGKKIIVGDVKIENAEAMAQIMNAAGFDVEPVRMDLGDRDSIMEFIAAGKKYGDIKMLVSAAGVSPSQAPIESILRVDLYGTAVLLREVGKVIAPGGAGVHISSQSGWRMPQLTAQEDELLAVTDPEELLALDILQPKNIKDTLHAYQLAKRCNEKRVMAESVRWGERGARINDIAPGIIVTPLAVDEFNGPRGDFYKNMFAKCPAGRPGTADEVADIADLLMSPRAGFITGSTFLADGGATASYFYGPLKPAVQDPEEARKHLAKADTLVEAWQYEEALAECNEAVALDTGNAECYRLRAKILQFMGLFEDARSDNEKADALTPDDPGKHYGAAVRLSREGDNEEALAECSIAVKLAPDNVVYRQRRAEILHSLARYEEVLAEYDRLIEQEPDNAEYHQYRAETLDEMGRYDDTLEEYDRVLALDPDNAEAKQRREEIQAQEKAIWDELFADDDPGWLNSANS